MYVFTQRLFPVPYEWRRLALAVGLAAVLIAGGDLLLPTEGAIGLAQPHGPVARLPLILHLLGFLSDPERARLRELRARALEMLAERRGPGEPGSEVYEAERRDEDARL